MPLEPRTSCRSALPPQLHALIPGMQHQVEQDHQQQHEQYEAVHRAGVKAVVGKSDREAQSTPGQNELGRDHADEAIGDGELDPRQHIGRRGGQLKLQCRRETTHMVDLRYFGQRARNVVEAVERREDHGGQAGEEPHDDDRSGTNTEHDDEQRIEGEQWQRVVAREKRIQYSPHAMQRVQHDTDRDPGNDGAAHRNENVEKRGGDLEQKLARGQDISQRGRHLARRDHGEGIDELHPARELQRGNGDHDQCKSDPAGARHQSALRSDRIGMRSPSLRLRMSLSENRPPLFRDMR